MPFPPLPPFPPGPFPPGPFPPGPGPIIINPDPMPGPIIINPHPVERNSALVTPNPFCPLGVQATQNNGRAYCLSDVGDFAAMVRYVAPGSGPVLF